MEQNILVHLDLKGAPPKPAYLAKKPSSIMDRKYQKRSKNFTELEKVQLLRLFERYSHTIENKKTDAASVREKMKCWEKIRDEFNSISTEGPRDALSLKIFHQNSRRTTRKGQLVKNKDAYLQNKLGNSVGGEREGETLIYPETVFFFSFVKSLGATGILLEWEDTFPYTDDIRLLGSLGDSSASKGHYTNEEALEILGLASQSNLTVIPLVQTIGHMEFVLKYSKFNHLRETKDCPNCLCPTADGSLDLVKCLVNQIISFHEHCEYIHIGADEVWHMGVCEKCVQLDSHRLRSLWLDHVITLALYIKSTYPSKKIIVWDDMLRNIDEDLLKQSNIGNLVEPMVWYYQKEDAFFNQNLWDKYCTVFPNIWAASAFKGATSSCQIIPTVAHHIQNQDCWIRGLSSYTEKIKNLRGIVLTGWSRFDHYATLCELLPCGIPSLFFSLMTLRHGEYSPEACETEALRINCSFPFNNMTNRPPIFPGSEVYVAMEWLASFIRKYKMEVNDDRFNTWFNPWQIKTRHVHRGHILGIHANLEALLGELEIVEKRFDECIVDILYNHTIEELKGTLIDPIKQHINKMLQDSKSLIDPGNSSKPQACKRSWLQAGMSVEENS